MSAKSKVIAKLQSYLKSDAWQKLKNKNKKYTQFLESLTEEDIDWGAKPGFIKGRVYGNSTGSGESTYGDTTTRRTVSINHVTNEKWFVPLSCKASKKTLERAFENFGFKSEFYYYKDVRALAEKDGKLEVNSDLYSLNFIPKEYRLNTYNVEYTSEIYWCKLWPIVAKKTIDGKKMQYEIGYWEEHDGKETIDIKPVPPLTPLKKLIIAGVIAAAVVGLALLLFL
ncbi:MAG: hypothetical protein J6B79_00275 [Clostridia bacterium]|nr:hypothetical protein [Clostridia bacterium]